jgi:hypothetical protein
VTVSGLSSGAYMAVQHGVIYSSKVLGVGAVAGGPFWCAGGSVNTATTVRMRRAFYHVQYAEGSLFTEYNTGGSVNTGLHENSGDDQRGVSHYPHESCVCECVY